MRHSIEISGNCVSELQNKAVEKLEKANLIVNSINQSLESLDNLSKELNEIGLPFNVTVNFKNV